MSLAQVVSRYEHPPFDVQCMDMSWKITVLCIQLLPLDQSEKAGPNPAQTTHNQDTACSAG